MLSSIRSSLTRVRLLCPCWPASIAPDRLFLSSTGAYVLRFDAVADELEAAADPNQTRPTSRAKPGEAEVVPEVSQGEGLSLDERAVLLATAVSGAFPFSF